MTASTLRRVTAATAVVVVTGASAAIAACGGGSGSSDPIAIGLLAPLTGASAADGESMRNGAKLVIKETNKDGGIDGREVELRVVDVQDQKPDVVAGAVQRLIGDTSVKAVVTGYASTTNFEIKPLAEAKMPYLLAGNSQQTEDIVAEDPDAYPGVWSLTPSYDAYGTELPRFLESLADEGKLKLRNRKAFIVTSDNPYSNGISEGLVKTLEELDWTIAGEETVPFGQVSDWGAVLSKIRAADPDLVVNTGSSRSVILVADAAYTPESLEDSLMPAIVWSPDAMVESRERIPALCDETGAELLFTHDRDYPTTTRVAPGEFYS